MKGTGPASARPVAKPTMFCSATPTLKNLPGKASENGSSAMQPRSAVSSKTRGSRSASSTRARMKDLRMASVPYFRERGPVLLIVHRHVVPAGLALHERHALAERRVGNEDVRRPSRQAGHRAGQGLLVMAVHAVDIPAEAPPAVCDGLRGHHVLF